MIDPVLSPLLSSSLLLSAPEVADEEADAVVAELAGRVWVTITVSPFAAVDVTMDRVGAAVAEVCVLPAVD